MHLEELYRPSHTFSGQADSIAVPIKVVLTSPTSLETRLLPRLRSMFRSFYMSIMKELDTVRRDLSGFETNAIHRKQTDNHY